MAFDYTARDYDTIRKELFARAERVLPEWTDRDPSDFGVALIDLWAYEADVLHYYIDRAAGEAFLPTATQRESLLSLANLFDYTPRSRTSAVANLVLRNDNTTSVTVDSLTKFIARYDGKTYHCYTPEGGSIGATSTGTIVVAEGELHENEVLTSTASGDGGQVYSLATKGAVNSSVKVYVYEDGVTPILYQRVSRITSAATGSRVYTVSFASDESTQIQFGNTLNGFAPPSGSKITATYAVSSGGKGNLPENSVTSFFASTPVGVVVQSSSRFIGGVDEESIEALRVNIPTALSAQGRAVTRNDFVSLAQQVDGVAKATIEYTPASVGASVNASVTVYAQMDRTSDFLTTSDTSQTVSSNMQTDVVNFIQPRALLGVDVVAAQTITWHQFDITATVHVNERYVANWVKSDVRTALDELFEFDNVFFGQRITLGQVYRIMLNVPGVDYVEITTFNSPSMGGSGLETSVTVPETSLPQKGTITLTTSGGITTS